MSKEFKFVSITTENNPDLGYLGYYCSERVTLDDIISSDDIPEDIKIDPHIYEIRKSDDGRRKATIEPSVIVNFDGCFITSEDVFGSMKYIKDKYLNILKFRYETSTLESRNRKVKVKRKNKHPRINTGIDYDIYYMLYLNCDDTNIRHEALTYALNSIHNNLVLKCPEEYEESVIVLSDSENYPNIPIFNNLTEASSAIAVCQGKESELEDSYLMKIISKIISCVRYKYPVKIAFVMLDENEVNEMIRVNDAPEINSESIIINTDNCLTPAVEDACTNIINACNLYHKFTAETIGEMRDKIISIIYDAYEHEYNTISVSNVKIRITTADGNAYQKRKICILAHFILTVAWCCGITLLLPDDWHLISTCNIEKYDESGENIPTEMEENAD